jgi:predicted acylesterase/phospholipase RssA
MKNDSSVVASESLQNKRAGIAALFSVFLDYLGLIVSIPYQYLKLAVMLAFVRLPRSFAIALFVLLGVHLFVVFPITTHKLFTVAYPALSDPIKYFSPAKGDQLHEVDEQADAIVNPSNRRRVVSSFQWLGSGLAKTAFQAILYLILLLVSLFTFILGFLFFYWMAVSVYKFYRRRRARRRMKQGHKEELPEPLLPAISSNNEDTENPLAQYKRIGIILSGGGAKGAYQAGALKAIYEFLEEHNAHSKVCMIAGTSIGAWNALFWLAGLVKENPNYKGGISPLEEWWRGVSVENIVQPVRFIPTRQNHFLSNEPWQESFNELFKDTGAGQQLLRHITASKINDIVEFDGAEASELKPIHFYFTRSNIEKAHLAFTTNNRNLSEKIDDLPHTTASGLDDVRVGVFSSMDIPPLFQYMPIEKDYFEDGGVIDNLPVRFGTEVEHCDLLFILPLNASFERKVDHQSVFRRLARVTEIRQGVLERNSFKMIRLYNELASLRKRIEVLQETQCAELPPLPLKQTIPGQTDLKTLSENKMAEHALHRNHDVVHVFSICPAPELKIHTTEFWKTKEAGEAFHFMYEATKNELKGFSRIANSKELRMILVGPSRDEADGTALKESFAEKSTLPVAQPIAAMAAVAAAGAGVGSSLHSLPATAAYRQFNEQRDEHTPDLQLNVGEMAKAIHKTAGDVTYKVTYFRDF